MHAHQHVISVAVGAGDIAQDQCHVFYVVVDAGVAHRTELAVLRGDTGLGYPLHMLLVLAPPLDQVGDRHQRQIVLVGEDPEFLGLRHGALVFWLTISQMTAAGRSPASLARSTDASV